ncbi:MAG TPA: tRNA adenosine(34) deaminase TadA [Bacillota bacterium]|nr:tRNA adenosine(34) deaminase TadA [Bacillota bacterium]HOK68186.1 tRNA adenosine(34) deaminase TadA [Bacillota bacterium]HPP84985.1 tRNA adenosine(34) deaminase TadA [Bacillota bacterium]
MDDIYFMRQAIKRAKKAASIGEVPVGAVIVKNGKIIASGYNLREKKSNALLHAEIVAIDRACRKLGVWRLEDCTLYVTLEPCPMCAGAVINSRIRRVVFGGYDYKAGAYGSVFNIADYKFNHKYEVTGGVLEKECTALLSDFFAQLRNSKRGF